MAANFPNSPTNGQTYSFGGTNYVYSTTNGGWKAFIGVGQLLSIQVFTASGTYTPTSGMEYCQIECLGAGAGGGSTATSSAGSFGVAGGGGGGAYARKLASSTTMGASQTVTVGVGSAGGVAGNNAGSAVTNDTSVGSICIAKKGQPGLGSAANTAGSGGSGGLASSSTGDVRLSGGTGMTGSQASIVTFIGGVGGGGGNAANGFGQGGIPTYTAGGTGQPGTGNGGGGGAGCSYNGGASTAGGAGTDGIVIITEFTRSSPVPGVASSTDNAIVRFDGTAGRVQDSVVTVADTIGTLGWNAGAQTFVGGSAATVLGSNGFSATVGSGQNDGLQIRSTNAGVNGASLILYSDSASPAVSDYAGIVWSYGRDTAANSQLYGYIACQITDATSGSEDSIWEIATQSGGAGSVIQIVPGGIKFPATQVASTDANTQDDYEEGTFSPTMTFGGSSTSVAYSLQQGRYTKIGDTVFCTGAITLTNNGTGTGAARIANLPFNNNATYVQIGTMRHTAGGVTASGIYPGVDVSGNVAVLYIPAAAADTTATETNVTDTFACQFTLRIQA